MASGLTGLPGVVQIARQQFAARRRIPDAHRRSMVHYAGYTPRFHPSDFATRTRDGVGADWPIAYPELRPYYEQIEQELPVAGERWPWGDPHGYPHRPHPVGGNGEIFLRGALKLGIEAKVGPVAIAN